MDLRRYQPLRAAGATWREIADEVGLDWRTVKKYLSADALSGSRTWGEAPDQRCQAAVWYSLMIPREPVGVGSCGGAARGQAMSDVADAAPALDAAAACCSAWRTQPAPGAGAA